jgi:hypothetical protein
MALFYKLTHQNDSVVMELSRDNKVIAKLVLDTSQVDILISEMGRMRTKLANGPSANPPSNLPLEFNPRWFIEGVYYTAGVDPGKGRLLKLRDAGFGWIGFVIPELEANHMARGLTDPAVIDAAAVSPEHFRDREAGPVSENWSPIGEDASWQGFGPSTETATRTIAARWPPSFVTCWRACRPPSASPALPAASALPSLRSPSLLRPSLMGWELRLLSS